MEMEERDFVTFTDDDGEEFELDVVDYFEYEGEEYAVLMDLSDECEDEECEDKECECECGHDHDHAHDVYIMKVVTEGDEENFVPADEDKFEVLSAIVEERLSAECSCGCDDEECDCEDGECEHGGCNCGCEEHKE